MNKKELRYAFNIVIAHAENATCEELHHPNKWQHENGDLCPALYNLHKQAYVLKEHMEENGIK